MCNESLVKVRKPSSVDGVVGVLSAASLALSIGMISAVNAAGPLGDDNATVIDDNDTQAGTVCDDMSIALDLEEPVEGVAVSGVTNLRGWATGPSRIESVAFHIDGNYRFDIPAGGKRGDVGAAYPDYPESTYSGFSMAYNYNRLEPGDHEFMVRATAEDGSCRDVSVVAPVARFANSFYDDSYEMDLSEAEVEIAGNSLVINGARIGPTAYDITMGWHTPAQKPKIDNVISYGLDELYDVNGTWAVAFTFNGDVGMEGDEVVCTEGGSLSDQMQVTHQGSEVEIGSTTFEYTRNDPLVGMVFEGQQQESIHGGTRTTDWALTLSNQLVSGSGIWIWSDGTSECSGTTRVVGEKLY